MTIHRRSMIVTSLFAIAFSVSYGCSGDRSPSVDEETSTVSAPATAPVQVAVNPRAPDAAVRPVAPELSPEAPLAPNTGGVDTIVPTVAGSDGINILLADFGDGVDARILQHPGTTFSKAQASRVYLWFRVGNAQKLEQDLQVHWESATTGKSSAPITLHIKPMATFTTWAYMSTARKPGIYRAVVSSADGTVLLTRGFELTE